MVNRPCIILPLHTVVKHNGVVRHLRARSCPVDDSSSRLSFHKSHAGILNYTLAKDRYLIQTPQSSTLSSTSEVLSHPFSSMAFKSGL